MIFLKCLLQCRDFGRYMNHTRFFFKCEMIILIIPHFHRLKRIPVVSML